MTPRRKPSQKPGNTTPGKASGKPSPRRTHFSPTARARLRRNMPVVEPSINSFFNIPRVPATRKILIVAARDIIKKMEEISITSVDAGRAAHFESDLRPFFQMGELWLKLPQKRRSPLRRVLTAKLASSTNLSDVLSWMRTLARKNKK